MQISKNVIVACGPGKHRMPLTIYYLCSRHPYRTSSQQETGLCVGVIDRLVVAGHTELANNYVQVP